MTGKGIFVGHASHVNGGPGFITGARRNRLRIEVPNRLFTFTLNVTEQDGNGFIHILQIHDTSGVPVVITPGNPRHVFWLSSSGVPNTRARRILKRVKALADLTATMAELIADNGAAATAVKDSPDLKRPLTFDAGGVGLTFETGLMHTMLGHDHPADADTTSASEIDGAVAEPL